MTRTDISANDGQSRSAGFLSRLRRCQAGNVLPMMAMAVVPIAGMIGSGLDMSRAYLAKAKLQTACDSTALATRRFMGGNDFDTDADGDEMPDAEEEGRRFFAFNYPDNLMGTTPVVLTIEPDTTEPDVVQVRANTTVPTSLMRIFGKEEMDISVSCDADQDYVHNDIMLVLDVTGSMNCTVGTNCIYADTQQSNSRLAALRGAAGALYRALEDVPSEVRIRYGFMPYSMAVNVSRDLPTGTWRTSNIQYWRRPSSSWILTPAVTPVASFMTGWRSNAGSDAGRGCVEERSSLSAAGAPVSGGTGAVPRIATAVTQADIDTISTTNDNLKWNPYNPENSGNPTGNIRQDTSFSSYPANLRAFCPARARRLTTYASETAFNTEVNRATSRVGGYTNHDLGLMWGARFLSPSGMFSTGTNNNTNIHNDVRVDRHIVFMTDGDMTSTGLNYSSYGMPAYQNRWTTSGTSDSQLESKHVARFLSACNRARQLGTNGTTIWVIALDVGNTADIQPCASSEDHFFAASTPDELEEAFASIGREIGKLRLTR